MAVVAQARKTSQLQIRVTHREKSEIRRRARAAGVSVSAWVLGVLLPPKQQDFQDLVLQVSRAEQPSFELAALNDLLSSLTGEEMRTALAEPPRVRLSAVLANQVAAMVEHAAYLRGAPKSSRCGSHASPQSW
jgi:hypothetical protein